jgi:8-oxo-dGTP diphosphatase
MGPGSADEPGCRPHTDVAACPRTVPSMTHQVGTPRPVRWATAPNTLTCFVSDTVPAPVTSVVAVVFNESGQLLVVRVRSRGWDLPGGHVEPGESLTDAVVREVAEESGVRLTGSGRLVGYQHLHIDGPREDGYKYPHPDAYMPMYVTVLDHTPALGGYVPEEVDGVEFRDPHEAVAEFVQMGRVWAPLLEHVVATGMHLGAVAQ